MNLGYTVLLKEPLDLRNNSYKETKYRQAAIAYADDTTWIANNKAQLESIIKIAEEFYTINDIRVNPKKSKLIVINSSEKSINKNILVANEKVEAEKGRSLTRFLGAYLSEKAQSTLIKNKARLLVQLTIKTIRNKKLTLSQLIYLNNMYLIPKLCYILQVSSLSKNALDSIHQPMIRLIKNKIDLPSTTSNFLVAHRNLGNCKFLWQELLTQQITDLHRRLNCSDRDSQLAEIRIKQGLLKANIIDSDWHFEADPFLNSIWRNNTTCLTLYKAKSFNMCIRPVSEQWHFQGTGPQIREVIDASLFIKSSKSISDLGIIYRNQLLDKEGKRLLTWQQLKAAKGKIKAGKKAKWFSSIEEAILQDPKDREIKEMYQTSGPNILAPLMPLVPISSDKRKKEWILIDKENDELETRKIVRKCNHKVLTERWSTKDNNIVPGYVEIEKSNSARISEQDSEYSWLAQNKVLTVISKPVLKSNQKSILRYKDIIPSKASRYNTAKPSIEERLLFSLQSIESIDKQLIIDQNFDINLANNLVSSLECNINSGKNSFQIYTDGSLSQEGNRCNMGSGWVQVDEEHELVLREGFAKLKDWPSSTKPELIAIWLALFTIPTSCHIYIYSDSAAAIASINKIKSEWRFNRVFKEKNWDILIKIADLISAKGVNLELKKVKGHSKNKWNDKADALAKKATTLAQLTDIHADLNTRISFPLYWGEFKVEKATRPFLKKIFETWNGTNWRLTESILALEPEANNSRLDWHTYWKRIKKLKGVRCNTLQKSKKLATQLKCLSGNLPVLKTLATRRPDIYSSDSCIVCNTGTAESQDHLAVCPYYKTMWQKLERTAINLVWSGFTEEEKFHCPKHTLYKILTGSSEAETQEKRRLWIKGLTSVDSFDAIKDLLNSSKTSARSIELAAHLM